MVNIGNVNNAGSERRGLSFLVFIGIIGFSVARGIATFFTNYLWFDSVNLNEVWVKILLTRLGLVAATTTIAFAFIFINLRLATRATPVIDIFEAFDTQDPLARFRSWVSERFARFRLTGALALSLFLGAGSSTLWEQVLLFINQENFNITDPVFNNDISNYIFGLPLYRLFVSWGFQLITLTSIVVVLYFIATGAMQLRPQKLPEVSSGGKAHLSVLLAFVAILKAVAYRLDAMELLYSPRGKVFGASYTDVTAHLPALQLLVLISLFGAGLLLVNIRRRGWLLPATALGLWLAVSIVVGGIVPSAIQRFRVLPDELNKELPYVEEHIDYTRLAYGLDAIEERPFEASPSLSNEDITQNAQTVNNIRLWDPTVLAETYSQLQEIRAYYALDEVDVDRYTIDGKLTQVMVSARELDQTNLPAQGWVNQRLQYTHGYGVVFSPANNVASQGQPDFYVKGVPATTTAPELEVSQPRIYFGESAESQEYVVVNSLQEEVDYPLSTEGQSVAYTNYSGQGGVGIGSFFQRLGFSLRYSELNLMISNQLSDDSKIIMERNVTSRVKKAAPFLYTDNDPYLALIEGDLFWIIDMYTVSDKYPYAQPADTRRINERSGLPMNFNYIRNSVKAVVNAYDGTMKFYVFDEADPLIQSYANIFPSLFTDKSEMSSSLLDHIRYPEDLFTIQSDMYKAMLPYYLLMTLPEEDDLSYLIFQPFNPENRPNMQSFLVADADPENYGQLIDYRLPKGEFVDGPSQVSTRINQDPDISQIFTLLDQQGSSVIRGNLFVVPINQSVLYYQPIYLQGEQNPLPEFKFVVVIFQDKIIMEESLGEALQGIFEGSNFGDSNISDDEDGLGAIELLEKANVAFNQAQDELISGNLGRYQELIELAEEYVALAIEELNK